MEWIFSAWGRILTGYAPALSIEITRECPLRCPGCYAYGSDHLGGDLTLRDVRDFKGQELVDGVMALIDRHRPLHVSISADLTTRITPCQFGGAPDCENCGCLASAGLAAIGRHQLLGFIPIAPLLAGSMKIGERLRRSRPAEPSTA